MVTVIEHYGESFEKDPMLIKEVVDDSQGSDSGDGFDYSDFGFLQAGASVLDSSPYITTHQNLDHIFCSLKIP